MPLIGRGALIFWHGITAGTEADFHHWHSLEHLPERLSVPGFLRGRRYAAIAGDAPFGILYEVEQTAVLTSRPYLDRLNNPTPWTRANVANMTATNRSICAIAASFGRGVGALMLTLRFTPRPDGAESLRAWLTERALPALADRPGMSGAHLLIADRAASGADTAEKRLREAPDDVADWVVLAEGYDPQAVAEAEFKDLAAGHLAENGAEPEIRANLFRLLHCLTATDA